LVELMPASGAWFLGQVGKFSGGLGILAGLFLVPVYAFYFLLEKRGIEREWTDYLPLRNSEFKDELVFILRSINDYLIVFFRSQLLVAMCDGLLYTLGFLIIGLPYAFIIGLMATLLTMIPFLGAITTCVAALLVGFASSGDWVLPAKVIAVFAVVQTLEGLVISPKIMGDRVGLHPLTIIIAVMVGTTLLGGLLGGILAIPLTAALRVLMFRYVWRPPSRDTQVAKTRSEAV
jgi:predicted PurR-regulated permease PerM